MDTPVLDNQNTYIDQFCVDTGCHLEESMLSACHDNKHLKKVGVFTDQNMV